MHIKSKEKSRFRLTHLLVFDAIMSALGVIFMIFVRFPLIPQVSYLIYDLGDIPAMIAGLLAGPIHGLLTLLVICLLQLFTANSSGFWGLLMHFVSSGALVLVPALLWKWKKDNRVLIVSLFLATIVLVGIMIPFNLLVTPIFSGVPVEQVWEMILPVLIPFNALKGAISGVITFILFNALLRASDKKILHIFDRGE